MIGQGFDFLHVIDFKEDTGEETYLITNSLWFDFFLWVGISQRNLLVHKNQALVKKKNTKPSHIDLVNEEILAPDYNMKCPYKSETQS